MDRERLLKETLTQLGMAYEDLTIKSFMIYMDMLVEWNGRINLTAITQPEEIILKHFADSLAVMPVLKAQEPGAKVIDVGTGAGFPGVPLKIMLPGSQVEMTLLDSLNKRVKFLSELINALKLTGIEAVHHRAEDAGHNPTYREGFELAISRAVADLSVLVEYCLPFVRIGGKFISMKGPDTKEELLRAEPAIEALGGCILGVESYKIPFTDITHSLIIVGKIQQTPSGFPRKPNKILKNPIRR